MMIASFLAHRPGIVVSANGSKGRTDDEPKRQCRAPSSASCSRNGSRMRIFMRSTRHPFGRDPDHDALSSRYSTILPGMLTPVVSMLFLNSIV